jgi:hypothetical protein
MISADLIREISKRTGIPELKVKKSVYDYTVDCQTIISRNCTGGFTIPNIGYVTASTRYLPVQLELFVKHSEYLISKKLDLIETSSLVQSMFFRKVDNAFACVSLILEHNLIKNENYVGSVGRKVQFDMVKVEEYLQRMDVVLQKIPVKYKPTKYSEIQNICMQRMRKQGILRNPFYTNGKV